MPKRNKLFTNPHDDVVRAAAELGENLKVARLRRGLSIKELAERIGTGTRAIADAERGKITTSISVYIALLCEYRLDNPFFELASPSYDEEGQRLLNMRTNARAKRKEEKTARFKSSRGDDFFLSYWERWDRIDEGY